MTNNDWRGSANLLTCELTLQAGGLQTSEHRVPGGVARTEEPDGHG